MPNESLHPMAHGYPRGYRTYWPYLRWYAALKQEQGLRVRTLHWLVGWVVGANFMVALASLANPIGITSMVIAPKK